MRSGFLSSAVNSHTLWAISLCGLLASACGDATFSGSNAANEPKGKPGPGGDQTGNYALTWDWSCNAAASSVKEEGRNIAIVGPGPHRIDKTKANGAVVSFKGEACEASKTPRDVVFVIDVSSSMNGGGSLGTDPMVGGTCGRMQALEKVLSTIKSNGPARFGVVTFGSNINEASTSLFADRDQLYANLLAQSSFNTIAKLICDGDDSTNYDAGLEGAEEILNKAGVAGHAREVYFISDGVPEPSANNGKAVAARLHPNTTIATVMIGGSNDAILSGFIASKDHLGDPLHARAEQSSNLAQVLSKLSSNRIVSAEIRHGSNKETIGSPMDFSSKILGTNFNFKAFTINLSDAPDGLAVEFKYRDRFGGEQTSLGELIWNDAP